MNPIEMIEYLISEFNRIPKMQTTTSNSYEVLSKAEKFIKEFKAENNK